MKPKKHLGDQLSLERLTIRELRERIAELKRVDLQRVDLTVLKARLTPLLNGYAMGRSDFSLGRNFYRGRLLPAPPNHIDQIGAPQPLSTNKYRRLNRPEHAMLYTNLEPASIFQEIRAHPSDTLALACYRAKRDINTISVGFDVETAKAKGYVRELPAWCYDTHALLSTRANKLINKFLATELLKAVSDSDHHLYKLSTALAEILLSAGNPDGLCYPSVANEIRSDNVAFRVEGISTMLELVRVDFLRVDHLDNRDTKFTFLGTTDQFGADGSFTVGPPKSLLILEPSKLTPPVHMHLEGKLWVIRTPNGELVATESDDD